MCNKQIPATSKQTMQLSSKNMWPLGNTIASLSLLAWSDWKQNQWQENSEKIMSIQLLSVLSFLSLCRLCPHSHHPQGSVYTCWTSLLCLKNVLICNVPRLWSAMSLHIPLLLFLLTNLCSPTLAPLFHCCTNLQTWRETNLFWEANYNCARRGISRMMMITIDPAFGEKRQCTHQWICGHRI